MLTRGRRTVERTFALAAIEARHVSARQRDPRDAVAVDVHAARREALHCCFRVVIWRLVVLGERGLGRMRARVEPNDATRKSERRSPDRTIGCWRDGVET